VLQFENINFDGEKDPVSARLAARYECPACKHKHYDRDKDKMLAAGEWRETTYEDFEDTKPVKDKQKVGFRWNALYSPWVQFGQIAEAYRASRDSCPLYKTFINCYLSQTWKEEVIKTSIDKVRLLIDDQPNPRHRGEAPEDTLAITFGADVQEKHVYWVVRAWGENGRSWLLDYGISARPADKNDLDFLDEILNRIYKTKDGKLLKIAFGFIDSRYDTQQVYDFCRTRSHKIAPSQGSPRNEQSGQPVRVFSLDKDRNGKAIKNGLVYYSIDTKYFKDQISSYWNYARGTNYEWRLFLGVGDEYLKQITAEQKVLLISKKKGTREYRWINPESKDNHWHDAEVLSAACAFYPVRVHSMKAKPTQPTKKRPALASAGIRTKY
jgi:phage terminase large subunit GpA-like protein